MTYPTFPISSATQTSMTATGTRGHDGLIKAPTDSSRAMTIRRTKVLMGCLDSAAGVK